MQVVRILNQANIFSCHLQWANGKFIRNAI